MTFFKKELTYTFVGGNAIQQEKVKTVVQEWVKYVNVKFTFVANGIAAIHISFDARSGSWSYVGNEVSLINANKATMNLGWIGTSDTITESEKGVILHKFGHTLGLMHEHQSPVRGGTITLKESGIYPCSISQIIVPTDTSSAVIKIYTRTQGWTEQQVCEQILDVYNARDVSNYPTLDLKSIMMFIHSLLVKVLVLMSFSQVLCARCYQRTEH